jgi:hypothetical protein
MSKELCIIIESDSNELFQRAVVKLLGPDALLGGKLSMYQVAEMFFHAGWEAACKEISK